MAKIEKLNFYKVESGNWYGIAFYEDGEISVTSDDAEKEKLINEAASELGDISKMTLKDKVKLLTEKGILHREIKDVIKHIKYDEAEEKLIVERLSGKVEEISSKEKDKFDSIVDEFKDIYHLNLFDESDIKKINSLNISDMHNEDTYDDEARLGTGIKNLVVRNWKKTIAILTAGAVLTVGGIHIGKKIQKDKQPEVTNNNPVEDDIYISEVTPNNEAEFVFDQKTPLPTPEPTPTPTVEPTQVPVTSPLCKVEYINQSGESLGEETIDLNSTDLENVFYVGNSEDYGGVDAMSNNLNNPEENAKPEYVNLIYYQNLVQDENDMKYINYLANLRNYVAETYITNTEDQDVIDYAIVDTNRSLVSLIKYDNKELNSGKSFSELSPDAKNIVLQIAQQISTPLVSIEMNVPYDITNQATGEVTNEFINYDQVKEMLIDTYEKVNGGYSR